MKPKKMIFTILKAEVRDTFQLYKKFMKNYLPAGLGAIFILAALPLVLPSTDLYVLILAFEKFLIILKSNAILQMLVLVAFFFLKTLTSKISTLCPQTPSIKIFYYSTNWLLFRVLLSVIYKIIKLALFYFIVYFFTLYFFDFFTNKEMIVFLCSFTKRFFFASICAEFIIFFKSFYISKNRKSIKFLFVIITILGFIHRLEWLVAVLFVPLIFLHQHWDCKKITELGAIMYKIKVGFANGNFNYLTDYSWRLYSLITPSLQKSFEVYMPKIFASIYKDLIIIKRTSLSQVIMALIIAVFFGFAYRYFGQYREIIFLLLQIFVIFFIKFLPANQYDLKKDVFYFKNLPSYKFITPLLVCIFSFLLYFLFVIVSGSLQYKLILLLFVLLLTNYLALLSVSHKSKFNLSSVAELGVYIFQFKIIEMFFTPIL